MKEEEEEEEEEEEMKKQRQLSLSLSLFFSFSLSLSRASPTARLFLMDVELLTLAMRRMTARGQLNIFNDTPPWASPV